MKHQYNHLSGLLLIIVLLTSCVGEFLDIKPDQRQRVPRYIEDYVGMLNHQQMNRESAHGIGWIGGDEIFISESQYHAFPLTLSYFYQKNAYTWNTEVYQGGEIAIDWNVGYNRILWMNLVLEGMDKVEPAREASGVVSELQGAALFHRALNLYNLAQLYCPVYSTQTAGRENGLPLRLSSNVTEFVPRASLADTYAAIVDDLQKAIVLLPPTGPSIFRPGRAAAYALAARLYLQLEDFQKAAEYAELALSIHGELLDFNALVPFGDFTFPPYGEGHSEIIFYNTMSNLLTYGSAYLYRVDTVLLAEYTEGDLRRNLYFSAEEGGERFIGSYSGDNFHFTGFATDELYLVLAECRARTGALDEALELLNMLRRHRLAAQYYQELQSDSSEQVLGWVLAERRKELVFRGTRWEDLRRLNKDPHYAKTLIRQLDDMQIALLPTSNKYVWPLPPDAIAMGGYEQNDR